MISYCSSDNITLVLNIYMTMFLNLNFGINFSNFDFIFINILLYNYLYNILYINFNEMIPFESISYYLVPTKLDFVPIVLAAAPFQF